MHGTGRFAVLVLMTVLASGCGGDHSALNPQGPKSALEADIIWLFTGLCAAIWAAVLGALLVALARARRAPAAHPLECDRMVERRTSTAVAALTGASLLAVIGLMLVTFDAHDRLQPTGRGIVMTALKPGEAADLAALWEDLKWLCGTRR